MLFGIECAFLWLIELKIETDVSSAFWHLPANSAYFMNSVKKNCMALFEGTIPRNKMLFEGVVPTYKPLFKDIVLYQIAKEWNSL